jgi:hypothetical protein
VAASELPDLERQIGRPLSPADCASIADLNDVPDALIAEARKLHPFVARDLLAYYTTPQNRRHLRPFVEDVVFGTKSVKAWRRGAVLVPDFSLGDLLCKSWPALLEPIGGHSDVRIVPKLADWQVGVPSVGAPARPWPEKNYQSDDPPRTISLVAPDLEPIPDLAIGIRRWIASRLARCLKDRRPRSIEEFLVALPAQLRSAESWSQDARAAAPGLLREFREFGEEEGRVPGFRGPDEWYAD